MNFIEKLVSRYDFTFLSGTIFFLFTSLVVYFMFIRWMLGACVITKIKRTKKERKARQIEIQDRTARDQLRVFIKWILCLCYTKEQKEKRLAYSLFVVLNYIYLVIIVLYWLICLLALLVPQLQIMSIFIVIFKIYICDGPVMIIETILFYSGYTKKI